MGRWWLRSKGTKSFVALLIWGGSRYQNQLKRLHLRVSRRRLPLPRRRKLLPRARGRQPLHPKTRRRPPLRSRRERGPPGRMLQRQIPKLVHSFFSFSLMFRLSYMVVLAFLTVVKTEGLVTSSKRLRKH